MVISPKPPEPFRLFGEWLAEAEKSEPVNPNAMALATVDASGLPDVRMVLLKGFDEAGFVFYSNRNSAKGQELAGNPKASLAFYWKTLARQVRVRGTVTQVSDKESDDYFATAPARRAAWRLGEPAVFAARKPVRVREGHRASSRRNIRSARYRVRPTGSAIAWRRLRSSSGTSAHSDCTTASRSGARVSARRG